MNDRLPRTTLELIEKQMDTSGLSLLVLTLGGLLVSLASGMLLYLYFGSSAGITGFSAGLLLTALGLFTSLRRFDTNSSVPDIGDRALIATLMASNRRATLITDLAGVRVEANDAFARIAPRQRAGLADFMPVGEPSDKIQALIADVRRRGEGSERFVTPNMPESVLQITGLRTGQFIIWNFNHQNENTRLQREIRLAEEWAAPLMAQMGSGLIIEDTHGKIHYANSTVYDWYGIQEDLAELPPFKYDEQTGELDVGRGKSMRIDIHSVDLEGREGKKNIGRYRFLRPVVQDADIAYRRSTDGIPHIDPLFDSAPISVVIVDGSGVVQEFNNNLIRHPAGGNVSIGSSILDIVCEEDRTQVDQLIKSTSTEALGAVDIKYNCQPERDGKVHYTKLRIGNQLGTVLFLIDKTQEKKP